MMNFESLIVFAAEGGHEVAKEAEGIAALGLDPKALIIQMVTWLLVFIVLIRFVFKPIIKLLQDRQDAIDEGLRLTTEMVAEKDKLEAEVDKTLKKARKEANEILSKTHDQATAIIKEAEESAQTKVDAMIEDARKRIDEDTARARQALEKEVVNLVVEATEAVLEEKIDSSKDASLIAKALKAKA